MFLFNRKKWEIAELKDCIARMRKHYYSNGGASVYLNSPKYHLIELLEWLVGYYENRTAGTPKEYLESLINNIPIQSVQTTDSEYIDYLKKRNEQIVFLYNWVYYKKIIGF